MPALPDIVRSPLDPDASYVVMASHLPLLSMRTVPSFLRASLAINRQLRDADGLVLSGLKAQPFAKKFWTFSVWQSREALAAFAKAAPHRPAMRGYDGRLGRTRFVTVEMAGRDVPTDWSGRQALALREGTPA